MRYWRVIGCLVVAIGLVTFAAACGGDDAAEPEVATETSAPEPTEAEPTEPAEPTEAEPTEPAETEPAETTPELSGTLTVNTWGGGYNDAEKALFADPFTAATGVEVTFLPTGTTTTGAALLEAESGSVVSDVVNADNPEQLLAAGALQPLPAWLLEIAESTAAPGMFDEYTVRFGGAAVAIACNPEVIERCPTTAEEFWNVAEFPGARAIVSGLPSAVLEFALIADGVPAAEVYPMDIPRAVAALEAMKDDALWPASPEEGRKLLADKEVGLLFGPIGPAHVMKTTTMPQLEVYSNGLMRTNDGMVVMKDAPNPDAAFAYIQWILEHPEEQAEWTATTLYFTPTKDLLTLLAPDIAALLPVESAAADNNWLNEHSDEIQEAYQEFLAG
ncbi:MAG: extracellular solute-binding protein [Thermoleophilia bacterium]|nr:extracellular solute-binding protein [Thermoleophilia bacterium]